MLRIQMSDYKDRSSLSRLIGAPPGYVGFGKGGMLTTALRRRPGLMVVFEDIDQAHPEVWISSDVVLQFPSHIKGSTFSHCALC